MAASNDPRSNQSLASLPEAESCGAGRIRPPVATRESPMTRGERTFFNTIGFK
jgi:hypothetical protein